MAKPNQQYRPNGEPQTAEPAAPVSQTAVDAASPDAPSTEPVASESDAGVAPEADLSGPIADVAPEGHVEIEHDDPLASITIAGEAFLRDEANRLFVPLMHLATVLTHGFRVVVAKVEAALDA